VLGTCVPGNPATLAPTQTITCDAAHTVTQADLDAGHYLNTACVNAAGATEACAPADVPADRRPSIQLLKTGTLYPSVPNPKPGDKITYDFTITNNGNVTLSIVELTDALVGYSNFVCGTDTLAPGASTPCTADYLITQTDINIGNVHNVAQACGVTPVGMVPDHVCDDKTTDTPIPQNTVLQLQKSATVKVITYFFTIKNNGNTTLDSVQLTDALVGFNHVTCDGAMTTTMTLAPGQTTTCSTDHVVQAGDIVNGGVTNSAQANATAPTGPVASGTASVTITPVSAQSQVVRPMRQQ
jgi:uncharacterized repeat protein (TIGR01451 family)